MNGERAIAASVAEARPTTRIRRSGFYVYMSAVLLLLVLVGFAPTLYLPGAFFDVPPIPFYLYLHGAILTGWFVWLLVQTSLANGGRIGLHRRLGVFGAGYAAIVVIGALMATLGSVRRIIADGLDLDMDISVFGESGLGAGMSIGAFMSGVVWSNLGALLSFAVLVFSAIVARGRSEAHKRLMLLASIGIMGPALARISRWPMLGGEQGPFTQSVLLSLLLAVVVNDLITRKRIHPATLFGAVLRVSTMYAANIIAATDLGRAFVRSLA